MLFVPALTAADPLAPRTWLLVQKGGLVARVVDGQLILPTEEEVVALGVDVASAHALGQLDGRECYAAAIPESRDGATPERAELPGGLAPLALRTLAGLLPRAMFGVAGRALHVIDWADHSRFCGRCGTATERVAGERCTRCPQCRATYYPRIAPAIIVLVRKGPQALLASNARFPGAFYSTLAGFSEIGESLEETLVREVKEEAGIEVGSPRYFGSQPWPFPHSLMIGFTAQWVSGDIAIDPREISDAKWFDADALPTIPPRLSIARALIDAWVAEVRG